MTPPLDNSPAGMAARAAALGLRVPDDLGPAAPEDLGSTTEEVGAPEGEESPWFSEDYATAGSGAGLFDAGNNPDEHDLANDSIYPVTTASGDPDGFEEVAPPAPSGQAPPPLLFPVWGLLSEDHEQHQLSLLWQWVPWLVERHELRGVIKPCWALHGPAVEALTPLYQRWLEVYLQPWGAEAKGMADGGGRVGHEALVWLDHLDTRTSRLAKTFERCVGDRHEDLRAEGPESGWNLSEEYYGQVVRALHLPVVG